MSSSSFPVMDELRTAVKEAFGIEAPTSVQDVAISTLLDESKKGSDVIVSARTGSGKTLAFLLPILHTLLTEQTNQKVARDSMGTSCLIVVPTRELVVQTGQVLERLLSKLKGPLHWIVSGILSGGDKRKSEKARLRKTLHIVVATPGRLLDHLSTTQAWAEKCRKSLRWLVIDEADRLMDMGFEVKMKEIAGKLGIAGYYRFSRLILCSATLKEGTEEFAGMKLKSPIFACPPPEIKKGKSLPSAVATVTTGNEVPSSSAVFVAPSHLQQKFIAAPTKLRFAALIGLLSSLFAAAAPKDQQKTHSSTTSKVVLFTICCDSVDFLFKLLQSPLMKDLIPSDLIIYRLHGSLDQKERQAAFKDFVSSKGRSLLVCTDVAARGLNLERVTAIIQYDAPCDINDYLHRAGRTARQEESGQSFLFLMPSEKEYVPVLRARGMAIGSYSWDPLVQWVKTVKTTKTGSKEDRQRKQPKEDGQKKPNTPEMAAEEQEEEAAKELDVNLRAKFSAWQEHFETGLKANEALFALSKAAYLATVRAYATHASSEKQIFHVKRLHLGHLASTFGLSQPPTAFSSVPKNKRDKNGDVDDKDKKHKAGGIRQGQGGQNNKSLKNSKGLAQVRKRSAPVSEFGAGDVSAFFSGYNKKTSKKPRSS